MKRLVLIIIVQFQLLTLLVAQPTTYTWSGGTSTDPTVGSNWEGGTTPTFTGNIIADILIIPTSGVTNWPVFLTSSTTWSIYSTTGIASITVESGATITFSYKLNIGNGNSQKGLVTINPGGSFRVINSITCNLGGTIDIHSDNTGEGQLIYGNISYKVPAPLTNVELYLPGGVLNKPQFHYFIPSVQYVDIGSSISEVEAALSLNGTFHNDLLLYDETRATSMQAGWCYYDGFGSTPPFSTIDPYQGYNIYLTGDDKIIFSGYLITNPNWTFNLSYTSGNADPGWNLIGNPFACNYDLTTVAGLGTLVAGIGNTVHYNHDGTYYYYNCLIHTGSSGYTAIVPPMTGFFVHVSAASSLNFSTSGRTFSSGDTRSQHKGGVGIESSSIKLVRLQLNSGTEKDESIVWIANDATSDYNEHYDGVKLFGKNTSYIYSELNFRDYFMKAVTPPAKTLVEVPLKVKLGTSGEQSISITQFDNMQDFNVKLKHGTVETPLKSGTAYTFNSEAGTYDDFSLIFNSILTGVDNPNETLLKTWYRNNYLYINYPSDFKAGNSEINIYDFNGRKVFGNKNLDITPGETKQIQVSLQKGFYLTEIITGLKQYKSKIVVY